MCERFTILQLEQATRSTSRHSTGDRGVPSDAFRHMMDHCSVEAIDHILTNCHLLKLTKQALKHINHYFRNP